MILVDQSTAQLSATYDEPTASQDGSTLGDLAYTNIYYQIGSQPPVRVPQVPATKLTGGGKIATTVLVPASAGSRTSVQLWVTATDNTGNESLPSTKQTFVVDRVAPSAPSSFSVA